MPSGGGRPWLGSGPRDITGQTRTLAAPGADATAVHEVRNDEAFLEGIVDPVQAALPQPGKIQGCFTQSLGRDGPRVDPGSAEMAGPLDQRDALSEVGGLSGPLFSGRPGTNYDQVIPLAHHMPPGNLRRDSTLSLFLEPRIVVGHHLAELLPAAGSP